MLRCVAGFIVCQALCLTASAQTPTRDYLFAETGGKVDRATCAGDPLNLHARPEVIATINMLGVPATRIEFLGCRVGEFATAERVGFDSTDVTYEIYYPVAAELKPVEFVPPLVHELGHVWQIRQAGGLAALRAGAPSQKIELGADYLTGVATARLKIMDIVDFQANRRLVGRYRETSDKHGCPEHRADAFRFGAFFDRNRTDVGDIINAYEHYDTEFFYKFEDECGQ